MKIIIIGIQGSGKSTQGKLLSKKLDIPYISTGDIFRKLAKENTDEGRFVKEKIQRGILIPDEKVIPLIEEFLTRDEFKHGYIIDGFPRTVIQAKNFSQDIDRVFYLKLSDSQARERIAKRTDQRNDETESAINKRIELFHNQTEPVIDYYRKNGKLAEVDGGQTIEEIFDKLCNIVQKSKNPN